MNRNRFLYGGLLAVLVIYILIAMVLMAERSGIRVEESAAADAVLLPVSEQVRAEDVYEKLPARYLVIADGEDVPQERRFFEASSPRKVGDTYYLIYSPRRGSRLAYATSSSPTGPFTYRGYIIDNGVDYPAGNDHGSIACLNGQWYVFYHRMTNHSIMSRRACVEKISFLPDGTIPPVEMTSLGFEESLNPYQITPAEIACVLRGGCFVTEKDLMTRVITEITDGCVMGYKYFDFGQDHTGDGLTLALQVKGMGVRCRVRVRLDDPENGPVTGVCEIGTGDGIYRVKTAPVAGRHALYLIAENKVDSWTGQFFTGRKLFELQSFVFLK